MTPSKIDKLTSIGFEDSIDDRAVAVAAVSSELLTNGDDALGGGVVGGVGGSQGEGGEGYEDDEDDGGDKEGEPEYATRLDDAISYRQNLDSGQSVDALQQQQQQQYPLPGGIGDLTYSTYGDGVVAVHSTRPSNQAY